MASHSFQQLQSKSPAFADASRGGPDAQRESQPLGGGRRVPATRLPATRLPATRDAELALHPSLLIRDILAAATAGHATAGHATAGHATAGHATAGHAAPRLETWPVRGALLRDSLLGPGDSLMLQRGAAVAPGELALVRIAGRSEPLLRRVHPEGSRLRLVPEDDRFAGEHRSGDAVEILGRVLSVVRPARMESQSTLTM